MLIFTAVGLILCAGAVAAWWHYTTRARFAHRWAEAQLALEIDDFPRARQALLSCQGEQPEDARVSFTLARMERRAGDAKMARNWLLDAKRLGWPADEIETEDLLGQALLGSVRQVAPRLRKVLDGDPSKAAAAYEAIVKGYVQIHALPEAHLACQEWVARCSGDWRARYWMGWILEAENYGTLAVEQYRIAAEANPADFDVRFRLAESLLNVSDFPAALPHIDACLQTKPTDPAVRFARARCLQALGKDGEAEPILQDLLRENPRHVPALVQLARLRLGQENPSGAVAAARRAVELEPTNAVAIGALAEALRAVQSDEADAWEAKAKDLTEQKDQVNVLTREAVYHPRDAEVRYRLGELLLKLGRKDEAISWWKGALAIDPQHKPTRDALAALSMPPSMPAQHSTSPPADASSRKKTSQ